MEEEQQKQFLTENDLIAEFPDVFVSDNGAFKINIDNLRNIKNNSNKKIENKITIGDLQFFSTSSSLEELKVCAFEFLNSKIVEEYLGFLKNNPKNLAYV